jgi:hypothetical protein
VGAGKRKRIPVPEGGVILGGAEENATVSAVTAALFAYSEVTFQSLDHRSTGIPNTKGSSLVITARSAHFKCPYAKNSIKILCQPNSAQIN